jgi:hypothetical protein
LYFTVPSYNIFTFLAETNFGRRFPYESSKHVSIFLRIAVLS